MAYAKDTSVSAEKTEGEIKTVLRRNGATSIGIIESENTAAVVFDMNDRRISFKLPLPDPQSKEFTETPSGRWARSKDDAYKAWEQACRSRWRGLFLCIKAKLESIEAGIETFDEAFLPHIQLPDGSTVGSHTVKAVALAYQTGSMPPMLPGPRS